MLWTFKKLTDWNIYPIELGNIKSYIIVNQMQTHTCNARIKPRWLQNRDKTEKVNSLQERYGKYECEYENIFVLYFRPYSQLFWNVFHGVPIQASTGFCLTNLEIIFTWAFGNETQKQCYYHYYHQWMHKT